MDKFPPSWWECVGLAEAWWDLRALRGTCWEWGDGRGVDKFPPSWWECVGLAEPAWDFLALSVDDKRMVLTDFKELRG